MKQTQICFTSIFLFKDFTMKNELNKITKTINTIDDLKKALKTIDCVARYLDKEKYLLTKEELKNFKKAGSFKAKRDFIYANFHLRFLFLVIFGDLTDCENITSVVERDYRAIAWYSTKIRIIRCNYLETMFAGDDVPIAKEDQELFLEILKISKDFHSYWRNELNRPHKV